MNSTFPLQVSASRRNAEEILKQSRKRLESYKLEQRLVSDARAEKTVRLRELRQAKEAADREAEETKITVKAASKARRPRRSKQT